MRATAYVGVALPIIAVASVNDRAIGGSKVQASASPFATRVLEYSPAPGQFVNHPDFNDPADALGAPFGMGVATGNNVSVVTLGGFGGYIVLGFDHPVEDGPLNPLGLDAIVFGNSFWAGSPSRHWAECATIEISLDENDNGLADDTWCLIPGSHRKNQSLAIMTWDSLVDDPTYPPGRTDWIPAGRSGVWQTQAYSLPIELFGGNILVNPTGSTAEAVWGYAEYSPTLILGDIDADNAIEDASMTPEEFYTRPDDPFTVGISAGSGGGDAFDIAWAIDPITGEPAHLVAFDFLRITTAVQSLFVDLGEKSSEVDAVSAVSPDPFGDADGDGDIDLLDLAEMQACLGFPIGGADPLCAALDRQPDGSVDGEDARIVLGRITGPL